MAKIGELDIGDLVLHRHFGLAYVYYFYENDTLCLINHEYKNNEWLWLTDVNPNNVLLIYKNKEVIK